jgi:hypothetical protein
MIKALLLLLVFQPETVKTGHFEIVTTSPDRAYVKQVADALESGYAAMIAAFGKAPAEAGLYRINLYANNDDYLEKDRELNDGRFAENLGFSHAETGEAYIAVQPRSGVPLLDRTRALIRHEAFHLMAYRHAVRRGNAPAWLAEGLSERAAEEADRATGGDPVKTTINFGEAVTRAQAMIERKKFIPLQSLLMEDSSSHKDGMVRDLWYAEAWLFVKFLAEKRPEDWRKFQARFRQEGEAPAPQLAEAVKKQLLESLGVTVGDLEKEWRTWIAALKPAPWWRIAGDWRLTRDGVEGAAVPDRSAYLMSTETLKSKRYRVRAEAQVMNEGTGQVDLVILPSKEDHAAANLVKVTVSRTRAASVLVRRKGEWTNVSKRDVDASLVDADKWIRLELAVDGRTVKLRVNGDIVVEHTFDDDVDELHDIRWGLGNYNSWTKFRAMEIRKN